MSVVMEYENQIYLDMFHNDGLLIMAEGLGIERIFLNFIKLYSDPTHLVLILNTDEAEEDYFTSQLRDEKAQKSYFLPTKITTETHSMNERVQTYLKGGCFFVTSRILVVDLLTERIPIELISGILVYKAHKVIDSCQETFILRMFRQKNKKGFIKAFSDNPVFFSKSSCKVDRVMKNLFVKKLFIYPRFHVDIETELKKHKPELIEIHVGLSENSSRTQMALLDIINVLLQEFKSCCSYIDPDFLTMEMVISKPFDRIIKSQLEPVWNQLGSKPKQLITDIKTLRLLLYYLTQYDCVTFYKMLNCLKSHEKDLGRSTGWMFLDAANELFSRARLRVYGTHMKSYTKSDAHNKFLHWKENKEMAARIVEESPKLKALKQVLQEIGLDSSDTDEINILIAANDDRTCSQIRHFLSKNHLTIKTKNVDDEKVEKEYEKFDILDEKNGFDEEKDEEFIVKMILKPTASSDVPHLDRPQSSKVTKILKSKKKEENTVTLTQMIKKRGKVEESESLIDEKDALEMLNSDEDDENEEKEEEEEESEKVNEPKQKQRQNTNLFLSAFVGGAKQRISLIKLLFGVKPRYVILYDSELWFVRELELYKAIYYASPMRTYFIMYTNSCEEQRYLTSIRTEKEAFERLIKEKAAMIVQEEQDGKMDLSQNEAESGQQQTMTISAKADSRKGGVAQTEAKADKPKIIADMREFRSELPSMLHKRGFQIEPVTLEVGDYVITPTHCVERKSINDLIESLSNGRLYNQANAMCRSYKIPILLIEFGQNKPFLLNSYQQLASNEISTNHTSSKLVLLTMHFPKLRILWSSSPSETAEIFEEMKSGCPQPDTETAMAIKTDQVIADDEFKYNPIIWDLLLKIPGINSKNIKSIMSKVGNLQELCEMSEAGINEIIENSKNAKLIFDFLNRTKRDVSLIEKEFDFEDVDDFNEVVLVLPDKNTEAAKNSKKEKTNTENNKKTIFKKKPSSKNLKKK